MIKKFRRKPVVIEAIQWTGDNYLEISNWCHKDLSPLHNSRITKEDDVIKITDSSSNKYAFKNDYIVKEEGGKISAYKPDIFEKTYEEIEQIKHPYTYIHEDIDKLV